MSIAVKNGHVKLNKKVSFRIEENLYSVENEIWPSFLCPFWAPVTRETRNSLQCNRALLKNILFSRGRGWGQALFFLLTPRQQRASTHAARRDNFKQTTTICKDKGNNSRGLIPSLSSRLNKVPSHSEGGRKASPWGDIWPFSSQEHLELRVRSQSRRKSEYNYSRRILRLG